MRPIKLGSAVRIIPIEPAPKAAIVFEDAPDDRIGFYTAKEDIELKAYRIPFVIKKGQRVEVVEDKGDRVLVHLDKLSTIYCDSHLFFQDFERG